MKNIKWSALFISIFYMAAGILFFVFPTLTEIQLALYLGYAAIIIGTYNCIAYFVRSKQKSFFKNDFMMGLLLITIGIVVLIRLEYFIELVYYILAIIIMLSGYSKLQDCVDAIRLRSNDAIIFFLLALVSIAIGTIIIASGQYLYVMTLDVLIGVGLLYSGLSDFVVALVLSAKLIKRNKELMEKQEQQVEPEIKQEPLFENTLVDDENNSLED